MDNSKNKSRRQFLITSSKGIVVASLATTTSSVLLQACATAKKSTTVSSNFITPFIQQPLPYAYDALESVIDAKTMEIHYSKHASGYSKNLLEATQVEAVDSTKPLEELLAKVSKYSTKMRNNAGGHFNHEMFWKCMRPSKVGNLPTGSLQVAIDKAFGSFSNFKTQFTDAAKTRFGSGWAWLYKDDAKNLKIGSTPNQDNPLMDLADIKGFPLLGLDVWEHAYYLKYQNKRADYIENWWNIVNWDYVQLRFQS
jgi:superoxide dismutase, Fe-Mn family